MMKTKTTLRKLAEPFAYLLMVAAFGFITTLANQAEVLDKSGDSELVKLNLMNGMEVISNNESLNDIKAISRIETLIHKETAEIDL